MVEALKVADLTIFAEGAASKLLGCATDPEALAELRIYAVSIINDGVSVVAIDKKKNKVAGIALNKLFVGSLGGKPFAVNHLTV